MRLLACRSCSVLQKIKDEICSENCLLFGWLRSKQGKIEQINKFGDFLVVVQLIHRMKRADISCTTMTPMFFFLVLADERGLDNQRETFSSIHLLYRSLPSHADHSHPRRALRRRRPEWVSSGRKVINLGGHKLQVVPMG